MSNFPTSLDSFVNPTTNDFLNSPNHVSQHSDINDAVEALEAKLGITASTPTSGKLLRGTGAGTSEWDKDAPAGVIVGTTDSQTLTNKTLTSPTINTAIINNPTLATNTISEFTAASGVTIDGLLIKDSALGTNNSVPNNALSNTGAFGSAWAWSSWVPTLTNLSGGTLNYALYAEIGKTVFFRLQYTLAGAGVAGAISFTSPTTMSSTYGTAPFSALGIAGFGDSGTAQYQGWAIWLSTTTIALRAESSATNGVAVNASSTVPFTFGAADTIYAQGCYERA